MLSWAFYWFIGLEKELRIDLWSVMRLKITLSLTSFTSTPPVHAFFLVFFLQLVLPFPSSLSYSVPPVLPILVVVLVFLCDRINAVIGGGRKDTGWPEKSGALQPGWIIHGDLLRWSVSVRSRREKNQGASATLQLKRRRLRENKPESHWKSPKEGEKVIDEASRWVDDRTDRERCEQLIGKSVYCRSQEGLFKQLCFYSSDISYFGVKTKVTVSTRQNHFTITAGMKLLFQPFGVTPEITNFLLPFTMKCCRSGTLKQSVSNVIVPIYTIFSSQEHSFLNSCLLCQFKVAPPTLGGSESVFCILLIN